MLRCRRLLRMFCLVMVAVVLCLLKEIWPTKEYFFNDSDISSIINLVYFKSVFNICVCSPHIKIYFVKCQLCRFNFYGLKAFFFSFTRCSCPTENNNYYYVFCVRLCFVLNNDVQKISVDVDSTDVLPLELIDIDKYLYDLKAFPVFIFNHHEEPVVARLDHSDQGNVFIISR